MGYNKTPKRMGKGEGGSTLPVLQKMLDSLAKDAKTVFAEAGVNDALRLTRWAGEEKLEVTGELTDVLTSDPIAKEDVRFEVTGNSELYSVAKSDSDGNYVISLYPGTYIAKVSKAGYMDLTESAQTVAEGSLTHNYTVIPCLSVESTTPAEDAVDVAVDTTIVVEFDRNIKFSDTDAELIAASSVVDEDDTEYTISSASISGTDLTLAVDGDLANGKVVTVTIPVDDTVLSDGEDATQAEELVFTFTTVAGS